MKVRQPESRWGRREIDLDDPDLTHPERGRFVPEYEIEPPPGHFTLSATSQSLVVRLRSLLRRHLPLQGQDRVEYQLIRRELDRRDATPADIALSDHCPACGAIGQWWVDQHDQLVCAMCDWYGQAPGLTERLADRLPSPRSRKRRSSSVSPALRATVFARDNYRCRYCGRSAPEFVIEVDHVLPVSKGGADDIDNLVTACWECNAGKGNRHIVPPNWEAR